jgi:hypothetical protein
MINKESVSYTAFYERFSVLEDAKIMEILKNQRDYQEAARNAAIQIAKERNLINSEGDLLAAEFQNTRSSSKGIFPTVADEYHRARLLGSLFRFLMVFSALPFVYGMLQFAKGEANSALLGIVGGVVWLFVVFMLKRTKNSTLIFLLLGAILVAGIVVAGKLLETTPVKFADFLVLIVGVLLPVYFLLYIKKLISKS